MAPAEGWGSKQTAKRVAGASQLPYIWQFHRCHHVGTMHSLPMRAKGAGQPPVKRPIKRPRPRGPLWSPGEAKGAGDLFGHLPNGLILRHVPPARPCGPRNDPDLRREWKRFAKPFHYLHHLAAVAAPTAAVEAAHHARAVPGITQTCGGNGRGLPALFHSIICIIWRPLWSPNGVRTADSGIVDSRQRHC